MESIRTIRYLEEIQFKIKELVKNRISEGYADFLKQVKEMNEYLVKEYNNNSVMMDELKHQPNLVQTSVFNQNRNEILSIGYLSVLSPYLFFIFFTLTLPIAIIYLIIRWKSKDAAVERLRLLDSHINRLIMNIKITSS